MKTEDQHLQMVYECVPGLFLLLFEPGLKSLKNMNSVNQVLRYRIFIRMNSQVWTCFQNFVDGFQVSSL